MKRFIYLLFTLVICVTAFAGCGQQSGELDNPSETEQNIQHISLSIDEAENPVYVSVENCAELEGRKDMIRGSKVFSNEKGSIAEVFSCSDFGTAFFGSYDVSAVDLDKGTICFDVQKQRYANISCGVNYYDLIMDGEVKDCDSIRVTYNKNVELRGVTGDFSIFIFTLSDRCPMQFGQAMITVSGTIAETGNVELTWDGERFTLKADTEITNCKAVTEISNRTEEFIDEAESSGTMFEITVADGKPIITGISS